MTQVYAVIAADDQQRRPWRAELHETFAHLIVDPPAVMPAEVTTGTVAAPRTAFAPIAAALEAVAAHPFVALREWDTDRRHLTNADQTTQTFANSPWTISAGSVISLIGPIWALPAHHPTGVGAGQGFRVEYHRLAELLALLGRVLFPPMPPAELTGLADPATAKSGQGDPVIYRGPRTRLRYLALELAAQWAAAGDTKAEAAERAAAEALRHRKCAPVIAGYGTVYRIKS